MQKDQAGSKIAVIGGGVSGMGAAYLLQRRYHATLFEKNDYLGGHTHTVLIPHGPDAGTAVDTGFIVMNEKNYPQLTWFLDQLGVKTQESDMSLSVHVPSMKVLYSSDLPFGLFAQLRNLWNPSFYFMVKDIFRFYKNALRDLEQARSLVNLTLGEYLARGRYTNVFKEHHLLPMAAAIWSVPPGQVADFPALTFLRFYQNHGLLSLTEKPQWRTIEGGSHSYVRAFEKNFCGTVLLNACIKGVRRKDDCVEVRTGEGTQVFDKAVIACHADEALAILEDPSEEEKKLLGVWKYSINRTVLHGDPGVMPPVRRAWASWNVFRETSDEGDTPVAVTYLMNRLQGLRTAGEYFVTLNRDERIDPGKVLGRYIYHHPTYNFDSLRSQGSLASLNGRRNTYYCGSYFGHGFHEDGIRSGFEVARLLGAGR